MRGLFFIVGLVLCCRWNEAIDQDCQASCAPLESGEGLHQSVGGAPLSRGCQQAARGWPERARKSGGVRAAQLSVA